MEPEVSVVVPTHQRPAGLAAALAGLRAQTLAPERFETIVVDDGSNPPQRVGDDDRLVRHELPGGPAGARNAGWRAARAPLVAFVDDDCVPSTAWLEAVLEAADGRDDVVVQGPVEPIPEQAERLTPLSHVIQVGGPNRLFVSANIAYPRALLERVGGFDESFKRACGEDVELGARVLAEGAEVRWAPRAVVYHEVRSLDLHGQLRQTRKWTDSVRALSMHPELRDLLHRRIFWKPTHPKLLLALAGAATRRPAIAAVAALPYLAHYRRVYAGDLRALARALPTHLAIDVVEIGTALEGSARYRTLMV